MKRISIFIAALVVLLLSPAMASTYTAKLTSSFGVLQTGQATSVRMSVIDAGGTLRIGTATATATVSGGLITVVTPVSAGAAYTGNQTVTITGGGGSGAVITAVVSGGVVTSYTISNAGTGYTTAPTLTIPAPYAIAESTDASGTADTGAYFVTPTLDTAWGWLHVKWVIAGATGVVAEDYLPNRQDAIADGYTTAIPTRVTTALPNAAPGSNGGLPTTNASNGVTVGLYTTGQDPGTLVWAYLSSLTSVTGSMGKLLSTAIPNAAPGTASGLPFTSSVQINVTVPKQ
jgi:hypothetical protein